MQPQRDVAGRRYLTTPEINALYFATHQMRRSDTRAAFWRFFVSLVRGRSVILMKRFNT
jgi:hypothetical protein